MRHIAKLERLSLGTIRCVREVLARKSMTMAAEHLGISQPAVSMQVARFETLSGIPIVSRNGNTLTVRDDAVASLIGDIVEAEDALGRIARSQNGAGLRLGLCSHLAEYYHHRIDQYLALTERFEIYIGEPSCLLDMFSRGELDLVNRPLFSRESACDLMTDIPLTWISASTLRATRACPKGGSLPVILGTQLSPFTTYAEQALDRADIDYRIAAHADGHLERSRLVAAGLGIAALPIFLAGALPKGMREYTAIEAPQPIRFGLFYNKNNVSFSKAESLFEDIKTQLETAGRCGARAAGSYPVRLLA